MSAKRILTKEEIDFIKERYLPPHNTPLLEISKSLNGLKTHKIKKVLKDAGIELRDKYWHVGLVRKTHKINSELAKQLIADYNNYLSIPELEEKYKASHQTLLDTIIRNGGKLRKPVCKKRKDFTEEKKRMAVTLYLENKSIEEIHKTIDIPGDVISKYVKSLGMWRKPIPVKVKKKDIDLDKLNEMCLSGKYSIREMAKQIGACEITISKVMKDKGFINQYKHEPSNKIVFTDEEIERIKYLRLEENLGAEKIAKIIGKSGPNSVFRVLNELGIFYEVKSGNFCKLTEENILDIVTRYENGATLQELTREYKVSTPNMKKLLIENDVQITGVQHNKESEEMILNLWLYSGLSGSEICEKLDVSFKFLKRIYQGVDRINPVTNELSREQKELIKTTIELFAASNNQKRRLKQDDKLKLEVQDEYVNGSLFCFQIIEKFKISEQRYRKWTRNLVRKNAPVQKNPMEGTWYYNIWIAKYGEEEAKRRLDELKQNASKQMSGENNPMYGVSPSHKAGAGYSGHYNGHYFRSLRELSFILDLEEKGLTWYNGEKIRIPFEMNGEKATYKPDFLVGNILYEIKPEKTKKVAENQLKAEAAIKFCKNKGWTYIMLDFPIKTLQIYEKLMEGKIVFNRQYKEKFLNSYQKYLNR